MAHGGKSTYRRHLHIVNEVDEVVFEVGFCSTELKMLRCCLQGPLPSGFYSAWACRGDHFGTAADIISEIQDKDTRDLVLCAAMIQRSALWNAKPMPLARRNLSPMEGPWGADRCHIRSPSPDARNRPAIINGRQPH